MWWLCSSIDHDEAEWCRAVFRSIPDSAGLSLFISPSFCLPRRPENGEKHASWAGCGRRALFFGKVRKNKRNLKEKLFSITFVTLSSLRLLLPLYTVSDYYFVGKFRTISADFYSEMNWELRDSTSSRLLSEQQGKYVMHGRIDEMSKAFFHQQHFRHSCWLLSSRHENIREYSRFPDTFEQRASHSGKNHERKIANFHSFSKAAFKNEKKPFFEIDQRTEFRNGFSTRMCHFKHCDLEFNRCSILTRMSFAKAGSFKKFLLLKFQKFHF